LTAPQKAPQKKKNRGIEKRKRKRKRKIGKRKIGKRKIGRKKMRTQKPPNPSTQNWLGWGMDIFVIPSKQTQKYKPS